MAKTEQRRAVMVTTKHRGVFFGYAEKGADKAGVIVLNRARMCIYWTAAMRGILGLASQGPDKGCRVSQALDEPVDLHGVTAVFGVSAAAVERWEAGPWS